MICPDIHRGRQLASDGVDGLHDDERHLDYPRTAGRWSQARIRGKFDELDAVILRAYGSTAVPRRR